MKILVERDTPFRSTRLDQQMQTCKLQLRPSCFPMFCYRNGKFSIPVNYDAGIDCYEHYIGLQENGGNQPQYFLGTDAHNTIISNPLSKQQKWLNMRSFQPKAQRSF